MDLWGNQDSDGAEFKWHNLIFNICFPIISIPCCFLCHYAYNKAQKRLKIKKALFKKAFFIFFVYMEKALILC